MRGTVVVCGLVLGLGLSGNLTEARDLPGPGSRVCLAVDVVDPSEGRPGRTRVFTARETGALELRAWLHPRLSGEHTLRLKLFTPRGYLYQEIAVPVSAGSASPRRQGGGRDGVSPAATRRAGGGDREDHGRRRLTPVRARLPVAGTAITVGSLLGRWRVVPYLDDQRTPCGRARRFVIER